MTIKKPLNKKIVIFACLALLFSVIINGFAAVVVNYLPVSGHGSKPALLLSFLAFPLAIVTTFLLMAVFLIVLLSGIGILIKQFRKIALTLLLASATYVIVGILCMRISGLLRQNALHQFTQRSQELVNAIKEHEAKYQHPPESLEELVPEFIKKVPTTAMVAYPNYSYKIIKTPSDTSLYYKNPWVLSVFTPRGFDFDQFIYFPKQNYPRKAYGGILERINDWAYVHE